jgi:hypothetical protein
VLQNFGYHLSVLRVTVTDVDLLYLRVRPNGPSDQIFKGLSGSPVLVGNRPIGLLMSVDSETGEGTSLRFDRAVETLRPFFGLSGKRDSGPSPTPSEAQPLDTGGVVEIEVLSWSPRTPDAGSRAANLALKVVSDQPPVESSSPSGLAPSTSSKLPQQSFWTNSTPMPVT